MSVVPVSVSDIAQRTGVQIASLGREQIQQTELSADEINDVRQAFDLLIRQLRYVVADSPGGMEYLNFLRGQEGFVIEMAKYAKASIGGGKTISFPCTPNNICVNPLFPEAIRYSTAALSSYNLDSWDMPVSAGTAAYILGASGSYYTTSGGASGQPKEIIVILQDGLIQVGGSPVAQQFKLISQSRSDLAPYTVSPLYEIPLGVGKNLYVYPTIGATWVGYDTGVQWSFMPMYTGTVTLKLIGFAFYEYSLFGGNLAWV